MSLQQQRQTQRQPAIRGQYEGKRLDVVVYLANAATASLRWVDLKEGKLVE